METIIHAFEHATVSQWIRAIVLVFFFFYLNSKIKVEAKAGTGKVKVFLVEAVIRGVILWGFLFSYAVINAILESVWTFASKHF